MFTILLKMTKWNDLPASMSTNARSNTSMSIIHSIEMLTCLAVNLFIMPALAIWRCHPSGWQLIPTGLSYLSAHVSGMTYRPIWVVVHMSSVAENRSWLYLLDIN